MSSRPDQIRWLRKSVQASILSQNNHHSSTIITVQHCTVYTVYKASYKNSDGFIKESRNPTCYMLTSRMFI